MKKGFKNASVRITEELYDKLCQYAESQGCSISDIFRTAVEQMLDGNTHYIEHDHKDIERDHKDIEQVLTMIQGEITVKNEQIDHLHQLLAMKEKNLATFGEQLDRTTLQLEDLRAKQNVNWWTRIFGGAS